MGAQLPENLGTHKGRPYVIGRRRGRATESPRDVTPSGGCSFGDKNVPAPLGPDGAMANRGVARPLRDSAKPFLQLGTPQTPVWWRSSPRRRPTYYVQEW